MRLWVRLQHRIYDLMLNWNGYVNKMGFSLLYKAALRQFAFDSGF